MKNKLTLTEQEELFVKDCKLINLKYEYNGYIGVSYTALVIRLRDMGLFEYHNILEYISNELNLGGVSQ